MRTSAWLVGLLLVGTACTDKPDTDTEQPDPLVGPELAWVNQPTEATLEGTALGIEVSATDEQGVARVVTYYRTLGERTWITAPEMDQADGTWTVELPGEAVVAPGLELYFKGEDQDGTVSFFPERGARAPTSTEVRRQGLVVPYVQSFDDVPNDLLREIGWAETSLEFEGYEWARVTGRSFSGDASMRHGRTPSNLDVELDDWLISPVLDLTSLTQAQVSWQEYGDLAEAADHTLWISVGSPNPRDGDFVQLATLSPPPEREWGRSDVVDLTAWADQPAAYLAWVYRGANADIWWLDDVRVDALAPDLRVAELVASPDPLSPGDSATLTLTLENRTSVDATDVTVSVAAVEGATFGDAVVVPTVAGDGSVQVEVPFDIDTDFYENGWLNLNISVEDDGVALDYEDRILVGLPSTLQLDYTIEALDGTDPEQLVRLVVGVGSPSDPAVEINIPGELRTSGTYTVDLDVTEYADLLPPAPGANRWWVRVENGPFGAVDAFSIEYGGEEIESRDVGPFFGFAPELYFIPEAPDPIVSGSRTSPSTVAPGSDVSWTLNLTNLGESTVGATTVSITTADPDVTLTSAGPVSIGTGAGWARGAAAAPVFAFSVDPNRKDSRPIQFVATVSDSIESFETQVDVAVPYPVLAVTGVVIDDFTGGDNDGLLDPDETANLEISISNVGGLSTFGSTTCGLSVTGGTATATVDSAPAFLGLVGSGTTKNEDDFTVTVTSGSDGDPLELLLTCTDRDETYLAPFQLELGQRPWVNISSVDDAIGDNRDAYRFDVVNGRYRSDGTTLQIELTSATPHEGLSGLFIEFWGRSLGAPYTYYNAVASGTIGNIRGFNRGFTPLDTFTLVEVDANTVRFDIPLSQLELRSDTMELGFGVGFCGGTEQYCDHFPDGWGAPYTGLNTSRWVTLNW
ncbi:MAG: hypothetical protein AB8H79_13095 [Myxococcota bacterium]